jgi:uncharacterized protein YciI
MFVLELTYTGSLSRVDELLDDHVSWAEGPLRDRCLHRLRPQGTRDCGVMLALGNDKVAPEKLVTTDPFSIAGICECRIIHFSTATVAPTLDPRPSTLDPRPILRQPGLRTPDTTPQRIDGRATGHQ